MDKWKRIFHIVVIFSLFFSLFPMTIHAETTEEEIVTIERYPAEELFNLTNLKPGDYAYRTLTIHNPHDRDIMYTIDVANLGDTFLFDELLLKITKDEEFIYDGKLKDYEGATEQPLAAQGEETIGFEVKFPEELGNEYQGKIAKFHLGITARAVAEERLVEGLIRGGGKPIVATRDKEDEKLIAGIHGAGSVLPKTATNIYTFLGIGILLLLIGSAVRYKYRKNTETNK